jgi:ribose transport system substrate-binding protein
MKVSRGLLVLAVAVAVAAAGCGGDDSGGGGSGDGGKDPSSLKIAFIGADGSQNFTQEMLYGAKAAGEEFGVDVKALAPTRLDGPAQVKLFQDAMRTSTDGVAIFTLTPPLLVRPEAQAVRQGIPVVAVDTAPPPESQIETYVGNDNIGAGKALAEAAIDALPAGRTNGTAVIGTTIPGVPVLDFRAEGMKEAFEQELPDFRVRGPFDTKPDPTQNFGAWSNLVNANRDADILIATGDPDNASLARINRANDGRYLTGAFDLNQAGLKAVADGVNVAVLDPQHFLKGYIATRLLIERATKGRELPKGWWPSTHELVTKENVLKIVERQKSSATKLAYYRSTIDEQFADPSKLVRPLSEAK